MFRPGLQRRDNSQGDFGYMRTIPGSFDRRNRAGDDRRMTAVELRALQKALLVAHAFMVMFAILR